MRLIGLAAAFAVSLVLAPPAAEGQPEGMPVKIGVLSPQSRETSAAGWTAFRRGLRDLGWEEGRNIVIEARFADGKLDRLQSLAEELLNLNVSLIVSQNSPVPGRSALVHQAVRRSPSRVQWRFSEGQAGVALCR